MNRVILVTAMLIAACVSSSYAQTQEIDGYTFIRGGTGSVVCLGKWIPSKEVGKPGTCEGQWADVAQLTAIATRQTAERLEQLILLLDSIDQKLADNNAQLERLIETTAGTQAAINQQTEKVGELMHDTISSRVDALSRRVLANETFRKELEKLKEDILTDLKKYAEKKK